MFCIESYACSSSAGPTTEDYWRRLKNGIGLHVPALWKDHPPQGGSVRSYLGDKLVDVARQSLSLVSADRRREIAAAPIGVLLASTKGFIEDYVWRDDAPPLFTGPVAPLLYDVTKRLEISPNRSFAVGNACSSFLHAAWLALRWLEQGCVDHALVLACDLVGPFVTKGFRSLHALSESECRPFDEKRDGLQLGEAACAVWLTRRESDSDLALKGIGISTDGSSITRPSESGEGLMAAMGQIRNADDATPDLVIAHGTATLLNDHAEDDAIYRTFSSQAPLVTATKGAVGHTLGASSAVDFIAACETIRNGELFSIANTVQIDPSFRCRYVTRDSNLLHRPFEANRILITSMGFGGVNAAAWIERRR